MSIRVLQGGLHSLLVDGGRPSARRLGLPVSGAADQAAYQVANALVGNAPDLVALEITLLGPKLLFEHPVGCVVFGAEFHLTSNKSTREVGLSFTAQSDEVLTIGGVQRGVRAYLAVVGGFQREPILGSRSAFRPLLAEDQLACGVSAVSTRRIAWNSSVSEPVELRVLPGPQRSWFNEEFFRQEYLVSPASNRMGLRLLGKSLSRRAGELTSEAVAPGAVQVANDGLPIILGIDGQTIGGYPKVAHVIAADLDRLAQLRPQTRVCFRLVTESEAAQAFTAYQRQLQEWLTRLAVMNS